MNPFSLARGAGGEPARLSLDTGILDKRTNEPNNYAN